MHFIDKSKLTKHISFLFHNVVAIAIKIFVNELSFISIPYLLPLCGERLILEGKKFRHLRF